MPELKVGSKAPKAVLEDQSGKKRPLAEPAAEYTVLYFYPKDDTPGCTLEAQQFTKHIGKFQKLKAAVVGVSGGTIASKRKFCEKYGLDITLLSDPDFQIAKKFGAFGEKKFMGRSYMGVFRKTFVLDKSGTVVQIYPEVKPDGHAEEVLSFIGRGTKGISAPKSAKKPVPAKKTVSAKNAAKRVSAPKKKSSKRQ